MKKIFLFNGPPGSGKDEACRVISGQFPDDILWTSFKETLFAAAAETFDVSLEWFMKDYDTVKEEKEPFLDFKSRREAMIWTAEDHLKPIHGKNIFAKLTADKIENSLKDVVLISDCGFVEEVEELASRFGRDSLVLLQLFRIGKNFSVDSRKYL